MIRILILCFVPLLFSRCKQESNYADKILFRADIQTMDSNFSKVRAMAIKDGRILAVGSAAEIDSYKGPKTEMIDAGGAYVQPAFIEGHGHFAGLGNALLHLNLSGTSSWNAVLDSVAKRIERTPEGKWITGRGWHQEKWDVVPERTVDGYPTNEALNRIAPEHPVVLDHASGHALIANRKAIELADFSGDRPDPEGGRIVRNTEGRMTGVFEENAEQLIKVALEKQAGGRSEEEQYGEWLEKARRAQEACYRHGITFFHDAGVPMEQIRWYRRAYEDGELNIRTHVMLGLAPDELQKHRDAFPITGAYDGKFTVRSVKAYVDGALGSYGAWLLKPYADKAGHTGQNVTPLSRLDSIAEWCLEQDMQYCTHAIGDRANREMLDLYEKYYARAKNKDLRWRIEHAQHISEEDIPRFGQLGVIPSVQAIHCTSDAAFYEKRLGPERSSEEAYPWGKLWESGAVVGNGTDCPVEKVNPLPCLYATVSRKQKPGERAYFQNMALNRRQALHSYTRNNAYMAFREDELGQLKAGYRADFIILSRDLLQCAQDDLLDAEVLATFQAGEKVYAKKGF